MFSGTKEGWMVTTDNFSELLDKFKITEMVSYARAEASSLIHH